MRYALVELLQAFPVVDDQQQSTRYLDTFAFGECAKRITESRYCLLVSKICISSELLLLPDEVP